MQANNRIGFIFSKSMGWKFFLVVVFPICFWAMILWFQEFEATVVALDTWAAVGEGAYFLVFALFESSVIFLLISLIMLLLPKKWDQEKVFSIVSSIYLIIAGWFMLTQIRYLEVMPEENWLITRLRMASLQTNTGKVLVLIFLASIILPPIFMIRLQKLRKAVTSFLDRINIMSYLYLFLVAVGFMIILLRNIS
jgi:hypothetical protein